MKVHFPTDRYITLFLLTGCLLFFPAAVRDARGVDLGTPILSEPLQKERFFDTERLTTKGGASAAPAFLEPQLGLSHVAREEVGWVGVRQKTHKIHGEAIGKLNLLDNVSLMAIARMPIYTYEARFGELSSAGGGKVSTDLMRNPGNLSWRSELGINLGMGVDLNLFYDRSTFGRVDRPGANELDEKFGTRFIIRFK